VGQIKAMTSVGSLMLSPNTFRVWACVGCRVHATSNNQM
jgi:hypothetical protein